MVFTTKPYRPKKITYLLRNRMMKKITLTCMLVFCLCTISYAQDYSTGIGFRGGYFNGLTIKHFISSRSAVEGIFDSRWRGFQITGLYEVHNQAFNLQRLKWYYGVGGHVGFWDGNYADWGDRGKSYTVVGIDGILGLEYSFREIPINIGLDWKPSLNIIGYTGFWGDGWAFSIRYIF